MRDFSKELIVKTSVSTTVKGKNIFIPEDATNGDMIKAVFPYGEYGTNGNEVHVFGVGGNGILVFTQDWWNAKYKGVE